MGERAPLDALAVDEDAVEAAVVEHADAVDAADDERVAARDRGVVEAHVRREPATDPRPLAGQRDDDDLLAILEAEVLARVGEERGRVGQPRRELALPRGVSLEGGRPGGAVGQLGRRERRQLGGTAVRADTARLTGGERDELTALGAAERLVLREGVRPWCVHLTASWFVSSHDRDRQR